MGYELNRLMQQYGVTTPTLTTSTAPVSAMPTNTSDPAALEAYQKNLANFMAEQGYREQYQNRMANTPMYAAAQFQPNQQAINTWATPLSSPVPVSAAPQPATVQGFYETYLGRQPDPEGLAYWTQQYGPQLNEAARQTMLQAAQPELLRRYPQLATPTAVTQAPANPAATPETARQLQQLQQQVEELRNPYQENIGGWGGGYAHGGQVKKRYATGGLTETENEQPVSPLTMMAEGADESAPTTVTVTEPVVAAPVAPVTPPAPDRAAGLQAMLERYGPQSGGYTQEVAAARERARAESEAFNNLITRHLESPESAQASKAEMYFRLAAAFGAPTRTGQFAENLGMVGQQLAQHARGQRESAADKRDLMLRAQQLKMGAAKEDLAAVRALEAESMKDRRAIAQEMIKEYISSGKPQSDAGKRAADMGLRPGTPEYQAKVAEFTDLDVQRKMGEIDSKIQALDLAGKNLELREQMSARLTPTELKMKVEAEDLVANGQQALDDLKQAYKLNENSFEGGWLDKAQRFALEAAGSKDPKVVNTRVMENLLGAQGLAKLRATFGGNPTEGERAILLELEGIGAKSKEERAEIMKRAYTVMKERVTREQRRLKDIGSGAYRMTEPGGIE